MPKENKTAILCEDNEMFHDIFSDLLGEMGYKVIIAGTVEKAKSAIKEQAATFNDQTDMVVVFADGNIDPKSNSGEDGTLLIELCRELAPAFITINFSGSDHQPKADFNPKHQKKMLINISDDSITKKSEFERIMWALTNTEFTIDREQTKQIA